MGKLQFVVPEYIHPPSEGNESSEGGGGGQNKEISEGVGLTSRGLVFQELRVFLLSYLKLAAVEQAISYFTVNPYFKARIIVFIDTVFFTVN